MTEDVLSAAQKRIDPHQKALRINLDASRYGTFAEIGAGQEVASWFFHVGASSGTVAKSMSAYDMTVSDNIYGKSGRYVSKERLIAMLDHEYELIIERLSGTRGSNCGFFAFADTVSARNFAGTNEAHGWMGLRFQTEPGAAPSQFIVHVNMYDSENKRQQEALGILGVNLLYGAFYHRADLGLLLPSLFDNISPGRLELDYMEASGPAFEQIDPRVLSLNLLHHGLTNAVLFDSNARPEAPTEFFHKRPILIERGAFRALHQLVPELTRSCQEKIQALAGKDAKEAAYILELTLNNLLRSRQISDEEILTVVGELCEQNHRVLVSTYSEFFHLTQFLRRFSQSPIGFVVSVGLLPLLLEDERYALLKGGVLEASARLFQQQVNLLVYPLERSLFVQYLEAAKFDLSSMTFPDHGQITAASLGLRNPTSHLLRFLVESGIVIDIEV